MLAPAPITPAIAREYESVWLGALPNSMDNGKSCPYRIAN